MTRFFDASALVKRYVEEPGTDAMRALTRRRGELAASRVSAVEVPAALARRAREGDLAMESARKQSRRFLAELVDMRIVEIRPPVVERAAALVWRHPLRAYDALQLASALHLAQATGLALTFVCADSRLRESAQREGLRTLRVG